MSENDENEKKTEGIVGPEDEGLDALAASDELAAALKEAEQSVEEREARRASGGAGDHSAQGASGADKMTIELLSQELQSLRSEHETTLSALAEAEDKHPRLQAEFENFRRRTMKEKQDTFKYGHQNLVKDLLAVVDNLDRAVVHGEENRDGDFQSLLQGVELVQKELLGALAKHGVESIDAAGAVFDPAVHEAMAQVPSAEVPPNTVLEVLQTGYMLRDRMLRPSRVVVAREADGQQAEGGSPPEGEQ